MFFDLSFFNKCYKICFMSDVRSPMYESVSNITLQRISYTEHRTSYTFKPHTSCKL